MKIKEGLKLKGSRVEIPNCGRDEFAQFLYEDMGYRVGAEIGVNRGEYSKVLCEAGLKVYAVDCWENYEGYKRSGKYKSNKDEAIENLKGLDCEIIHKYSADAAKDFEDNSLDFVYIDGNHTLPYIVMDIFLWERKVKKGGIIAGHDYATIKGYSEEGEYPAWDGCHVKPGVDACAEVMKVKKLYILGERKPTGKGWRDNWRSWFWIK